MNTTAIVQALDQIPARMAEALVELLPQVEQAGYLRFLDMMFHYTRASGARLREAAAIAQDPELARFYAELAEDEQHHYRLAEADLRSFGARPNDQVPAEVAAFQEFWAAPVAGREHVLLGALFALEQVAGHLGGRLEPALQRLALGPANARFVFVHMQADVEHGAACRRHVVRVADRAGDSLVHGAQAAGALWLAMHRCLAPGP